MTTLVRPEREGDHADIADVVAAAFGSDVEAKLVNDFRASPGYLPELALVAEVGGQIVGHVMFTLTTLEDGTGILMLSPLAVRPDRQRTGVGTALVEGGLARCRLRGEPVVVVEGDPRYYGRFGFREASALGLEHPYPAQMPPGAFQALVLREEHPRGRVEYPPALTPFYER